MKKKKRPKLERLVIYAPRAVVLELERRRGEASYPSLSAFCLSVLRKICEVARP